MSKLTLDFIDKLNNNFVESEVNQIRQRSVMKNGILASSQNESVIGANSFVFSIDDDSEQVANQRQSGRCWMYSCLNVLRHHVEKTYKLKEFEFSQNYTNFYDKLEKSNYFHQNIIDTADKSLDDRTVRQLLQTPQQDGGDWDLIVSIIDKYGVVPKSNMPETYLSKTSADLNTVLNTKLRQDAIKLRELVNNNSSKEDIEAARQTMLEEAYTILAVSLGTPPETVSFEYRDTDNNYHSDFGLTPKEFYNKYVGLNLMDYVELINVPTETMPYNTLFSVNISGNMVGGYPNRYLNVDIETLKSLTIDQLRSGEPVWFACDVLQSFDRKIGIMATGLYDIPATFGITDTMNKGQRFDYRESLPTHAMVIGGVDLVDEKPTRWKVENSWGPDVGDKGFFVMNDDWMSQYAYAVAIRKDLLSEELQKIAEGAPTELPFWNEMYPL